MHDLRTIQRHKHFRALGCFLTGLLVALQVKAAGAPVVYAENAFVWLTSSTVGAGVEQIGYGSSGSPVRALTVPNVAVSNGSLVVSRSGSLALPGGAKLPINATQKIPGSVMGAVIKKALPLVPVLGTGFALYKLAKELGFTLGTDGSGTTITQDPTSTCTAYHSSFPSTISTASSCLAAAQSAQAKAVQLGFMAQWVADVYPVTCSSVPVCVDGQGSSYPVMQSSGTGSGTPVTEQVFADAIANKIGWPDSSAIAEALNQSQRATGEVIPTEGPKVTGPATVQGPAEVTKKPIPNGTRETTTQTDYNCTYIDGATVMDGGTVACTQKVTTTDKDTVTDPQTQQTTTTTTQTSETTKPADTTAEKPLETKDPCDTNPDRVGCATLDTPEGEIPKTTKNITYQAEDLGFGGGSCPANVVQTVAGQTVTVIDWAKNCDYMVTYMKPVVLAMATFSALMLLFAGKTES